MSGKIDPEHVYTSSTFVVLEIESFWIARSYFSRVRFDETRALLIAVITQLYPYARASLRRAAHGRRCAPDIWAGLLPALPALVS